MAEVGSNVAAFLGKLWRMVEDPETNDLISWSENGQSFLIRNQSEFARELLPKYYKHNNMASFIRQLNMYGFHKIVSPDSGGLKTSTHDEVEFSHTYFIRGHSYMLEHIKRKITKDQNLREMNLGRTDVVNKIIYDVKNMKGRQESFDTKLSSMKQENEALWQELSILRQKHSKQQQIVNKLINFLVSLVQPSRNGLSVKKINLPMIRGRREHTDSFCSDDSNFESSAVMPTDRVSVMSRHEEDSSPPGPIIHELGSPDFLDDIDILQGRDSILGSPLATVEEVKTPAERLHNTVDLNLLSSNTENNPLLLDLVKDVINEDETLVSLPPEQIQPVAHKRKRVNATSTARNCSSTVTTVSTAKRAKGKKTTEEIRVDSTAPDEFMDVNLIKVESHPSPPETGYDDTTSSSLPLTFDPMNCFAESPSPSELDLPCNLSSSELDVPCNLSSSELDLPCNLSSSSTDNQCVMYKSPGSFNIDDIIGRSDSNYFRPGREQFDTHVDTIQNDLDSLKYIMKGEGISLDASTLLNLFENVEEPLLPPFKSEDPNSFLEKSSDVTDTKTTYDAPSIDFSDMFSTSGLPSVEPSPQPWLSSLTEVNTPLNTPLNTPGTPVPNKRRKK